MRLQKIKIKVLLRVEGVRFRNCKVVPKSNRAIWGGVEYITRYVYQWSVTGQGVSRSARFSTPPNVCWHVALRPGIRHAALQV